MPPPAEGFTARFVRGPALRTQPDRRLVTLVHSGYETAFEEIVRRYGKPLNRYAAAIVGGRGEDVVQDSFSKALLALRRGDAEIELRPWLYRIVRNTALNDLRDRPPSAEALAEAIAGGANPAEEAERREELTDLMRRLQSLPEPQRAAIVMRELEGLSHEEIAAALGLSGGAARQAIYRARRALRDGLGLLLPLPLLKALLAGGAVGGAEVATGAVGAAGAGSAGLGASAALKTATATVLVAGAVGTGVAVQQERGGERVETSPVTGERSSGDASAGAGHAAFSSSAPETTGRSEGGGGSGNEGPSGHGDDEPSEDRSGRGSGDKDEPDDSDGRHRDRGSGRSDGSGDDDGRSGHGGNSGPGGGDEGGAAADPSSHHRGGSGSSGTSGSGGSGHGSDDVGELASGGSGGAGPSQGGGELTVEAATESDSSGPGGGSGSNSGSGSGEDDVEPGE